MADELMNMFSENTQRFISRHETIIEPDEPKLIGHLNKTFGYMNCKPVEIGTDVFELKDSYFFMVEPLKGISYKLKFSKSTLKPCIKFNI